MNILWFLALTLNLYHSQAVDEYRHEKDGPELRDCSSDSCISNLRPLPMAHREEHLKGHHEDRFLGIRSSFTCNDKPYIPGFYADVETGCKVFHICRPTLVESYMCPDRTGFDQKTLRCRYLNRFNCHLTPKHHAVNELLGVGESIFRPGDITLFSNEEQRMYDFVHGLKAKHEESLEMTVIKMLVEWNILKESDVAAGILDPDSDDADKEENAKEFFKYYEGNVLQEAIHHEMASVLPMKYSSEPANLPERPTRSVVKQRTTRSAEQSIRLNTSAELSKSSGERITQIFELIRDVIGLIAGRIAGMTGNNINLRYVQRFLKTSVV